MCLWVKWTTPEKTGGLVTHKPLPDLASSPCLSPLSPSLGGHSPSRQHLGNLGPAVAQHLVGLTDDAVLLLGPAGLFHLGVEVVVPALTTLLSQTALQVLGNQCPLLGAVLLNQLDDLGNKPGEGSKPAPTSHQHLLSTWAAPQP